MQTAGAAAAPTRASDCAMAVLLDARWLPLRAAEQLLHAASRELAAAGQPGVVASSYQALPYAAGTSERAIYRAIDARAPPPGALVLHPRVAAHAVAVLPQYSVVFGAGTLNTTSVAARIVCAQYARAAPGAQLPVQLTAPECAALASAAITCAQPVSAAAASAVQAAIVGVLVVAGVLLAWHGRGRGWAGPARLERH